MARRKNEGGGESDLMERTADDVETALHDAGEAVERGPEKTSTEASRPNVLTEDVTWGKEDDAAEEKQSSAALVGQADRGAVKRANFSRLASKRVSGVLERLSVLKQLSNTSTYDWTQEQHNKIFDTIGEQLDEVIKAFVDAKKPKMRDKSQLRFEV